MFKGNHRQIEGIARSVLGIRGRSELSHANSLEFAPHEPTAKLCEQTEAQGYGSHGGPVLKKSTRA